MPLGLELLASQVFSTVSNISASQSLSRFYTFTFLWGYFQKIISQQKRKVSHPRIKQYFCSKPKEKFLPVSQPKSVHASSRDRKNTLFYCAGSTALNC